jgi:hypothetical protein
VLPEWQPDFVQLAFDGGAPALSTGGEPISEYKMRNDVDKKVESKIDFFMCFIFLDLDSAM